MLRCLQNVSRGGGGSSEQGAVGRGGWRRGERRYRFSGDEGLLLMLYKLRWPCRVCDVAHEGGRGLEYERLREMQLSFTKRMYDYAVAYLQRTLQRTKTEGVGDCWLWWTTQPLPR